MEGEKMEPEQELPYEEIDVPDEDPAHVDINDEDDGHVEGVDADGDEASPA
jgi:hypothetical protein